MTSYSSGGFFNHGYHDSETLEIDKRFSNKPPHSNPYDRGELAWRGGVYSPAGQTGRDDSVGTAPWGGWPEESWRGRDNVPMSTFSNQSGGPSRRHNLNQSSHPLPTDSRYDRPMRLPSSMSGSMTLRLRGSAMRRISVFPSGDPNHLAFTEDAIRDELENEEQDRIKGLVALSTLDQIREIRNLPVSFAEKKYIRSQVLAFESDQQSRQITCCSDCSDNVSRFFRRLGYSIRSARQAVQLWRGVMKEIGGKYGTGVLSYFQFLRWLLMFSIFSFLINFSFITIPLLALGPLPSVPQNVTFRGLELLTGAGYFTNTVMYYGGYNFKNGTQVGKDYNMQLAYFFTIAVYMTLCTIVLIFSMASSFKKNFVQADPASNSSWQLLCSWDFNITNERAVKQRKDNLHVQLKESLSEKAQTDQLTASEKLRLFGIHLGSWVLSSALAVGCGAGIYFLSKYEQEHIYSLNITDAVNWSLYQEAQTLLVPFVVSLMNLVIPLFYSLFNKFEHYSSQRRQIYALVLRNVLLKVVILGVLCDHWMNDLAENIPCWESLVGQALYRLVIFDFIFLLLGSFFGEFLSNVIGTMCLPRLGVPEFDVARNVLELIYGQTLVWIGIYFSPLLPAIQIVKFFILFYIKKVSLTKNCQPPRRSGRAAQMKTIFIALLFFPFLVGALSIFAYTSWRLTPSQQCGPFQGINNSFSAVSDWIDALDLSIPGSQGIVWIYENIIRSEIFYYFITLIIVVIIYIFWQVTQGRKQLIRQLRQQIINEGKDKSFLLDKLQNIQKFNKKPKRKNQNKHSSRHSDEPPPSGQSGSGAMVQALLARQRLEAEEEGLGTDGVPVPSSSPGSSALSQAMLARQRAQNQDGDFYQMSDTSASSSNALMRAMQARQVAEGHGGREYYRATSFSENASDTISQAMQARQRAEAYGEDDMSALTSSVSGVMMQVMQARQRAEEPSPAGSSALIQAMLARQQAQNEYDDGY
ncbi:uncharacterized protein V6R79_015977 [Siganus canaliculatus]